MNEALLNENYTPRKRKNRRSSVICLLIITFIALLVSLVSLIFIGFLNSPDECPTEYKTNRNTGCSETVRILKKRRDISTSELLLNATEEANSTTHLTTINKEMKGIGGGVAKAFHVIKALAEGFAGKATPTSTTVVPDTEDQNGTCSSGYTFFEKTGFCYKLILSKHNFAVAKMNCRTDGADLASIHSAAENEFLNKFYLKTYLFNVENGDTYENRANVWIGLVYVDGGWRWTDGSPVDYEKWAIDEPNNVDRMKWEGKAEHWTEMITRKQKDWSPIGDEWNSVTEDERRPYFCKKPRDSNESAPEVECPAGYQYFVTTGFCYKVTIPPVTFFEAKASCESVDAQLISIHSPDENQLIGGLYNETLAEYRRSVDVLQDKSDVWIGLRYRKGQWRWTDESELDYLRWASGEPNDLEKEEDYSAVMVLDKIRDYSDNGDKWNNVDEDGKYGFVCKAAKRPAVTRPAMTPRKCSTGYTFLNDTGSCYQMVNQESDFEKANAYCRLDGANLTSIHSKEENYFLAEMSRKDGTVYSKNVRRLSEQDEVVIGLHYENEEWRWTDGTEVDYTNWAAGEPNRMGVELKVTLVTSKIEKYNPNGRLWNNIPTRSTQRAFICKKNPTF